MSGGAPGLVELCLLRHAHAGDATRWLDDDDLRPLTEKGRRQAERLARHLAGAGYAPDVVLASPLVRARETAEIAAEVLHAPLRIDARLGGMVDLATLERILADAGDPSRPILVGHDPDFSELVSELVGAPIAMRKATLARVDVERPLEPGAGELRWLLPPELFRG
jgi:phosphohistidine phosphatase